jgi:error-prone DNA polymerase
VTGVNTGDHLLSYARDWLRDRDILASYELAERSHHTIVRVAEQNRVAQTAKGMTFLTLEDEWGMINIVVRPDTFGRYARIILDYPLLLVEGILERGDGTTINIVAKQFAALPINASIITRAK